jgi:hypothetical protein
MPEVREISSCRTPKRTERYERKRKISKSRVDFGAAHSTSKCSGTTAGHSQIQAAEQFRLLYKGSGPDTVFAQPTRRKQCVSCC